MHADTFPSDPVPDDTSFFVATKVALAVQ
jgi:hypothetical protein